MSGPNSNFSELVISAVTESYLNIVQDISQGVSSRQVVNLDCTNRKDIYCLKCIKFWSKYNYNKPKDKTLSLQQIRDVCEVICECKMSDVKISENITLNLSSQLFKSSTQKFISNFNDSLVEKAKSSGQNLYVTKDRTENIEKTVSDLHNAMQQDSFQSSIQSIF